MAKKKAKPQAVKKRPFVTHGGKKIELPQLSGPVGEPNPDLASKHPRMNAQADVEIVEYYLGLLSDVNFFATAAGDRDPGPHLKRVCEVVQTWDKNLPAAIRGFQDRVGIEDAEEKKYGIIRPDGPTLTQLVDLGDVAEKLELRASAKDDPSQYIYRGDFDTETFIKEYNNDFAKDAHFSKDKEAHLREFLGFLTADPFMIDIRWMAYILATVFWENEARDTVLTGKKDKKGKPITHKVWHAQWSPVEEVGQGAGRSYHRPVKVKELPNGSARVTEQDGDQWIVNLQGVATPTGKHKHPTLGSSDAGAVSKTYKDDNGDELAYYGRGYAQLTWWSNYASVGAQIGRGLDLLLDPDEALDPQTSYDVLSFSLRTGKGFANRHKLADFFYGAKTDYVNARAMVNGKSHAEEIAAYARKFEAILLKSKKP